MELSKIGPKFRKKIYQETNKDKCHFLDQSKLWWNDFIRIFTTLFFLYFKARYLILTKVCCRAFFFLRRYSIRLWYFSILVLEMECVIAEIFFIISDIWLKNLTWKSRYIPRWFSMLSLQQCSAWLLRVKLYCCIVCGLWTFKVKKDFFLNLTFVRQKSGLQQGMFLKV